VLNLPYQTNKGKVYDVSKSRDLYGPGQPYEMFAGHDITVALARRSDHQRDILDTDVRKLTREEVNRLEHWVNVFVQKYQVVGYLEDFEGRGGHFTRKFS